MLINQYSLPQTATSMSCRSDWVDTARKDAKHLSEGLPGLAYIVCTPAHDHDVRMRHFLQRLALIVCSECKQSIASYFCNDTRGRAESTHATHTMQA